MCVRECLKNAWDSEYKDTVISEENMTTHTVSAALKFHYAERLGSVEGTLLKHWLASFSSPSQHRSDDEIRVAVLRRQMHKLSDFPCLPYFN